jgi:hypothetical protein
MQRAIPLFFLAQIDCPNQEQHARQRAAASFKMNALLFY